MEFIKELTNNNSNKPELKIISFSGLDGATKNMTVYECGNDIIIVDVGVGFPDEELPGIEVVIPDFSYILENKDKVRGAIITHGHEDHLGAVPYLLRELDVPIYANPLVQGFLKERLVDRGSEEMAKRAKFHLIGPDVPEIKLGNFAISTFKVNHSVPTTLAIVIKTPQGTILHMADFKIDWTPVIDDPIDLGTLAMLGKEGVLCLLSDCLGANHEGYSKSEQTLKDVFHDLFERADQRQIMVTTISSNISRMHQIIDASIKVGRKVILGGRSINNAVEVARSLGMLPFDSDVFISEKDASKFSQKDLVYIVAGCFGQQGSSLDRISRDEHKSIYLEEDAMVVFSADPSPPGTRVPVERLMDRLTLKGAEVIYSKIQENLHVSGHGPKGDLTIVAAIAKPRYFIPIGGTATQARAYRNMVVELGNDPEHVFELLEGESVVFSKDAAKRGPFYETKQVYVDGSRVGNVGEVVIRDREHLSNEGVFVVVVPMSKDAKKILGKVEVITRGFIYVKESKTLMGNAKDMINKLIEKEGNNGENWSNLQNKIEKQISKYLEKETGGNPMVIVHSINV